VPQSRFRFRTTADLKLDSRHIISQKRAVASIEFGLGMESKGYHLYVAGPVGTGKHRVTRRLTEAMARKRPRPDNWCYVHDFHDPDRPMALSFPAGIDWEFAAAIHGTVAKLREDIPKTFRGKEHEMQKQNVTVAFQEKKAKVFNQVEERAKELRFQIQRTEGGFVTLPLVKGKPLTPAQFAALNPKARKDIERRQATLHEELRDHFRALRALDQRLQAQWKELDRYALHFIVEPFFHELNERFAKFSSHVADYLREFEEDIMVNHRDFLETEKGGEELAPTQPGKELAEFAPALEASETFQRHRVNLLVDGSETQGAPVVEELNPSYYNLVGRVEKTVQMGMIYTDFTRIKAGSLLRANEGYLFLNAADILRRPFAWNALKRALISREVSIEDIGEAHGGFPTTGLRPEPIPLHVKVLLFGNLYLYQLLHRYDEDFRKIFKVRADFETDVPFSVRAANDYARFLARIAHEEKLPHFDASSVAAVVEFGARLADNQKKLSLHLIDIADLAREAAHWCRKEGRKTVVRAHVERALEERLYRSSLISEKIRELIAEGTLLVDTRGSVVGQVNGLSVYDFGHFAFGRPARITAATRIGEEGIVDIERRAKLSHSAYDKGVLIISGLLGERFAHDKPLSLATSLCFEQSYSEIDGDSASVAEFCVILSSIARVPIRQGIAITGSVNQKGAVQAVGGVNEKIEGFFEVCRIKGLTGRQGVVIPKANEQNLMLKKEVVEAVRKKKFHIYAISKVDEAVPLLMGKPAGQRGRNGAFPKGTLYALVDKRLREMALTLRRFGDHRKKPAGKKASSKPGKKRKERRRI
jgi:lon-related putative ATP-dependent protease